MQQFISKDTFTLENGGSLEQLHIAYNTYGTLNKEKDNVIWICHALTANSEVEKWWPGMVGPGECFDTNRYFIVCANILGSCYGTTGPLSEDPRKGSPFYKDFPFITIRDMVKAHQLLAGYLGISKIELLVGGSMGGYQAIEWSLLEPELIQNLFLIATAARESAWRKAIHAAQRISIEADQTWGSDSADAGKKGLKAARAIGMIAYRSFETYSAKQEDSDLNELQNFKAASYIEYQGTKFINRFDAYSYWFLTYAMDSHQMARGREASLEDVLGRLRQKSLIIGISSDILCPIKEQEFLAEHIKDSTFIAIDSIYGHDGFLVETEVITGHLRKWLSNSASKVYASS
jgi:homoserine O-acetyltransferase